ncbi:S9 family peptidase [Actinoplanes sp. RD1]|uniref:S9 family peptidase n=1 Tax=Actinoplanes sp. RD1 TaxID=3064538 RepID=UPI002740A805|nr:alpha/beta fold hydrolase [Actinoplanes sp. RD1]
MSLRDELLAGELHTHVRLAPGGGSVALVRTTASGPEIVAGDKVLATEHDHSVGGLMWTPDGTGLLYRRAPRGTERWELVLLRLAGGPPEVVSSGPVTDFWAAGEDILYAGRGALFRCRPGAAPPEEVAADRTFHRWLVDRDLRVRGGIRLLRDGGLQLVLDGEVRLAIGVDEAAMFAVVGFSGDGTTLYVLSGHDAPTRRLLALGAATETLYAHPKLDVEGYPIGGPGVWFDPRTGLPDLCQTVAQRPELHSLTPARDEAVRRLNADAEAVLLVDRAADDRTWLIVRVTSDGPIHYELIDPETGAGRPVLVNRPGLLGRRLPRLTDLHFPARDGTPISGYALRPLDRAGPLPTVVVVHGGPAGRDYYRFHAEAQFLAALGYQSLHVNYRGSRGFGSAFRLAGNGEWGGLMQQDLYDAVAAGVERGLVDPARVAFLGSSYGGFSALLAACTRPDLVRCAVAISPPTDLAALVTDTPGYWRPLAPALRRQILGGRAPDGDWLRERSPVHTVRTDSAPMLVAHGVRDPRVPVAAVDEFVRVARAAGPGVTYLRFDGEGHHVASAAARRVLFSEIEHFLEAHLVHDDRPAPAPAATPVHA